MNHPYRHLVKELDNYSAIKVESWLPTDRRQKILVWLERLIVLSVLFIVVALQGFFTDWITKVSGLGVILMVAWSKVYLLNLYVAWHERHETGRGWLLSLVYYSLSEKDLTAGFISTAFGRKVVARAEITNNELEIFLKNRRSIPIATADVTAKDFASVSELFSYLLDNNPDLLELFIKKGINKNEAIEVAKWEQESFYGGLLVKEWWRRDRLARLPGLGKDWSFGKTHKLEQFGRFLSDDKEVVESAGRLSSWLETETKMENVLAKREEPNLILTGDSKLGLVEPLWLLAREIKDGTVPPPVEGKKIFLLSASSLAGVIKDGGQSAESVLTDLLDEGISAGNLILAVDNLPLLFSVVREASSDLSAIWNEKISGRGIQVIGLSDKTSFHDVLVKESVLLDKFEIIQAEKMSASKVVGRILSEAETACINNNLFFSYQAIGDLVKSAEDFFPEGDILDESRDLLIEIIPWAKAKKMTEIHRTAVKDFISQKTGVPVSVVGQAEKEKLVNLEEILAQRVVGQKESLKALAGALRRGRAGTRNPNRPIGSFLFLGPTGVGKTETAKALAWAMFGDADEMSRLDMTEFSGPDAIEKLTGSARLLPNYREGGQAHGRAGILSKLVRERPYGVLLLDEFEKTDSEVLNLFLQILDEGFFTDAEGRKLFLRNMVIIATSNAGAEMIWDLVREDKVLSESKDFIIDTLVQEGKFRPELLNRFDATILYSPLSDSDLVAIAKLQLGSLAKRLLEQGLKLKISNDLASKVAEAGKTREFGARPLTRFIQDNIEEPIATSILEGKANPGSILEFDADLNLQVKTI